MQASVAACVASSGERGTSMRLELSQYLEQLQAKAIPVRPASMATRAEANDEEVIYMYVCMYLCIHIIYYIYGRFYVYIYIHTRVYIYI